jgi:hypothetical protein
MRSQIHLLISTREFQVIAARLRARPSLVRMQMGPGKPTKKKAPRGSEMPREPERHGAHVCSNEIEGPLLALFRTI